MTCVLYIVSTPIGNLEDITLRALRILKEVDSILCEDKRVTLKLLNKYNIKTKLTTYQKFNENKVLDEVLLALKTGNNVALVSDAGTPLISDPGLLLIRTVAASDIKIVTVPGPSSLISAVSLCPYSLDEFLFVGFLPQEKNKRIKLIKNLSSRSKNIVIFIAPHDIKKYTSEIYECYSEADVFYGRELTKIYEECYSGKIRDLVLTLEKRSLKGEIVLILNFESGNSKKKQPSENEFLTKIEKLINSGKSLKETSKVLAGEYDVSSKYLYDLFLKAKK